MTITALPLIVAQAAMGQTTPPTTSPPTGTPGPLDGFFPGTPTTTPSGGDPLADALGTSMPQSVRTALDELRAHHLGGRLWFYLRDGGDTHGDSIYVLPDGRILRLAPNPSDLRLYTYNSTTRTWTEIGTRIEHPTNPPHADANIAAGITAIIASRTERSWAPESVRSLAARGGFIHHSHGIYLCPGCRDSLYVLPNGTLLNINRDGSEGHVYTSTGFRRLTADELRGADVQRGIQAIIRSRTQRGWTYPGS